MSVSASAGEQEIGILKRFFRNNIVQAIIAGLAVIIIVGLLAWVITNNLIGDLREELQEIRDAISSIQGSR